MEEVVKYRNLTEELISKVIRDVVMESSAKNENFTLYTGYGGMITFDYNMKFRIYGRSKLPRKMKKRIFGTKKDRLQYLPEYYKQ